MARPDLKVTEGAGGLRIDKLRKSYRKRVVIRDVTMELNPAATQKLSISGASPR